MMCGCGYQSCRGIFWTACQDLGLQVAYLLYMQCVYLLWQVFLWDILLWDNLLRCTVLWNILPRLSSLGYPPRVILLWDIL